MSMARPVVAGMTAPRVTGSPRPEPTLRPVATRSPRRRPKMFYAAVSAAVILGVIVAQILLSIALQSGAYEISGLQQDVKDLSRAHQSAARDIDRLGSPQNLARSAEALGMVSNSSPAYLRLSTGQTTGWISAATAGATLYPNGDMVPNAEMSDVFAEREAAKTAEAARDAASQHSGSTSSSGASPTNSSGSQVPSQQSIPAPATH